MMIDLASPSAAPSPDWVTNAFPASVRGDQDYLRLCLDTLESLIFQDSVLPELRPKPLDPVGESRHRLVFQESDAADDDTKKLFFRTTEAALFNSMANVTDIPTLRSEMALHFPTLLGEKRSFGHPPTRVIHASDFFFHTGRRHLVTFPDG